MTATTFLLLAAAVSVALLLVLHLRLNRRQDTLHVRMVAFEQAQRREADKTRSRLEETATRLTDLEERATSKFETIDGRLHDLEDHVLSAIATLEAMGDATEAAQELTAAKVQLDEIAAAAESRFQGVKSGLDDAAGRVASVEQIVEKTHAGLDQRLTALERRVIAIRAGTATHAFDASPSHGGTSPQGTPGDGEAPDEGSPSSGARRTTTMPATAPDCVRVVDEGLTLEGEVDAPVGPGVKGLLVLVAMLAGLMMLFHWLGVGQ